MASPVAVKVVWSDEEREVLERSVSRPALPGRACLRRRCHQHRGCRAPGHQPHDCARLAGKVRRARFGRPARRVPSRCPKVGFSLVTPPDYRVVGRPSA
jgi:hypothetical protein